MLTTSQPMRNFIGSCRSQATKTSYSNNFARFLQWSGLRDAQLLTMEPKALQQQIINFMEEEKERGLSYKSLALLLSAIKHFLV